LAEEIDMPPRKAHFYIKRLEDRGWTPERICKLARIHRARFNRLRLIGTLPTRVEITRLRSLMKVPSESQRALAREAWITEAEKPVVIHKAPPISLTPRQRSVLEAIARVRRSGLDETALERVDASLASRMRRQELTYIKEVGGTKMYGLTPLGLGVCKQLGIKTEPVN